MCKSGKVKPGLDLVEKLKPVVTLALEGRGDRGEGEEAEGL